MKRAITASAVIFLLMIYADFAAGDQVILKDGRTLTGTAIRSGTIVILKGPRGEASFPESEVAEIIKDADVEKEYETRAAKAGQNDKTAQLELAAWCARAGLDKEEKYHLLQALRTEPEDAEVRRKLGYVFFAGRWMTDSQMMSAKGLVRYGREWVTPDEKGRLEALDKRAADEAKAQADAAAADSASRKKDAAAISDAFAKSARDLKTLASRRIGTPKDWSAYLPPWWYAHYYKYKKNYPQYFGGK